MYYYGVTPTYEGRAGGASAGGVFDSCDANGNALVAGQACAPIKVTQSLIVLIELMQLEMVSGVRSDHPYTILHNCMFALLAK